MFSSLAYVIYKGDKIVIPKINWPKSRKKGNPFGGINGFRPLSITFHSRVIDGISEIDNKSLKVLYELSNINEVEAMSFDGSVYPKIEIDPPSNPVDKMVPNSKNFRIVSEEGKTLIYHGGISRSQIGKRRVEELTGANSPMLEGDFMIAGADLLEAETHRILLRDIFITTSPFLINNREKLNKINIRTPAEAIKIIGLYIRNRPKWTSYVGKSVRISTSNRDFYWILSRAKLPENWRFVDGLTHVANSDKLVSLAFSILDRCSSSLRARDEIAKLFYMPSVPDADEQQSYHFDYLTLLLTSALDAQALIINQLYDLGLKEFHCGFTRGEFLRAIEKKQTTKKLSEFIESYRTKALVKILYGLRNKIHSISLDTHSIMPVDRTDEIIKEIFKYDSREHWGISIKPAFDIISENRRMPAHNVKVDKYYLAVNLMSENFSLINSLMNLINEETFDKNSTITYYQGAHVDGLNVDIERYGLLG